MAGRRKGEERRVNHDLFVGIRKWNQLDQARVRELFESPALRQSAATFIALIRKAAPNMEQTALEALAHGLVRETVKLPLTKEIVDSGECSIEYGC